MSCGCCDRVVATLPPTLLQFHFLAYPPAAHTMVTKPRREGAALAPHQCHDHAPGLISLEKVRAELDQPRPQERVASLGLRARHGGVLAHGCGRRRNSDGINYFIRWKMRANKRSIDHHSPSHVVKLIASVSPLGRAGDHRRRCLREGQAAKFEYVDIVGKKPIGFCPICG